MKYADLRDFLAQLERRGELKRVGAEVDPRLEMTEICDRVLKAGGPALLFERPKGFAGADGRPRIPVLGNLFGTPTRVALGMGEESVAALREVGQPARVPQGARAAEGPQGRVAEHAAPLHAGDADGAEGEEVGAVPGDRLGRRRRRSRAPAGADLLAGRRRAAHHLGPHRHARAAQDAPEPRHLPAAGDRARTR